MLNKNELLERMLKHFPRWTEIRKRATKSTGGKVAAVIAEETAMIQEAIEDYKKDFFIENYMGKEENILSLAYRIYIGIVDINQVKVIAPEKSITKRLDLFLQDEDYVYYEDGWIYTKEEVKTIEYSINDFKYSEPTEAFHVWNVFDEFAAFVGLTREMFETNQELENRILNVFKEKQNSSAPGLKQAILTELINIDPSLRAEDILIEGVTPSNLQKQYDEFTTILDKLASINKDVYRLKQWDIDTWQYPLKTIAYISHFWDVALASYKNGIGKDDDLAVSISKPNDKTDAVVRFYVKSEEQLVQYLMKQDIYETIRLNLVKHNDVLNPYECNYRIKASELIDITDSDIAFQVSDVKHERETLDVNNFVKESNEELAASGIAVKDKRALVAGKRYVISLCPDNIFADYYIKKINHVSNGNVQSLLNENDNWKYQYGELRYTGYTFFGNQAKHFSTVEGSEDVNGKATLAPGYSTMTFSAHIENVNNKQLRYSIGTDLVPIPTDYIKTSGFDYNELEGEYSSRTSSDGCMFKVQGEMNGVKMYVKGKAWVRVSINGREPNEYSVVDNYVTVSTYRQPMQVDIEIISASSTEQLVISNVRYAYFKSRAAISEGDFIEIEGSLYFPNISSNDLTIEVTTYSACVPYLNYVVVGEGCTIDKGYVTHSFVASEGDYIEMEASKDFFSELIPLNEANHYLKDDPAYIKNYRPTRHFKAMDGLDKVRVPIDLSEFTEIDEIKPNVGKLKSYYGEYYIEIEKGDNLETIFVSGYRTITEKGELLVDIFDVNVEKGEKLYISNIFDGFAIKKDDQQKFVRLKDLNYYEGAFKNGIFEFKNLPENISAAFEKGYANNTEIEVSQQRFIGRINNAYLHANGSTTSIAYNKNFIFQAVKNDVEIINTFRPFLKENEKYMFLIENMTEDVRVRFLNNCGCTQYENYALSMSTPIELSCDLDLMSAENYAVELVDLDVKIVLSKNVALKPTYQLETGDAIELQHYMINPPKGITVNYETINHTSSAIEEHPDMYGYEIIYMKDEKYNKLINCNIDEIVYIGTEVPEEDSLSNIPSTAYKLLHEEGILVWSDDYHIDDYSEIYVKYTLKKPVSITIDDDLLYDTIKVNNFGDHIDAYEHIKTKDDIYDMGHGELLDLTDDIYFNSADCIIVDCSLPSFSGHKEGKGIRFMQEVENNVVSLKSGYYYFDGIEYFLFANPTEDEVSQVGNTKFFNVVKENNMLFLRKISSNYVKNSCLNLQGLGNVFNQNFENEHSINGASSIRSITACNSFNHWKTIGMDLGFDKGLNDVGLKLMPIIKDGYALLDITEGIFKNNKISLYATNGVEVYIGQCPKDRQDINLIEIKEQLQKVISDKNILEVSFKNEGYSYFLIAKGAGVIDDIILMDANSVNPKWQYHKKNIDTLGFEIEERRADDYTQRLLLTHPEACSGEGAELIYSGYIINSPYVEWIHTPAKTFLNDADWATCELTNLRMNHDFVEANITSGKLTTPAIYIGDKRMIKNVIIKVNEIELDQMVGLRTSLLTSSDSEGSFTKLPSSMSNVLKVKADNLMEYIKLEIEVPKDKVISSIRIYIEYISTDEAAPVESIMYNGKLISQILDAYQTGKYKLTEFNIEDISDPEHVNFFIRGARETSENKVWTDWKQIILKDGIIENNITFNNYRYFQILVSLKHRDAYVKLGYIDMKVVR